MYFQSDSESFGILNGIALVSLVFFQRDYPFEKNTQATRYG